MLRNFSAVIVTGGSSGIGKSFIELMARMVPGLPICNLSRRSPDITGDKLNLRHVPCDLKAFSEIERVLPELEDFLNSAPSRGPILLLNNSGFGAYGEFPEPSLEHQLEMIEVNVKAVMHLTARLLPRLKEQGGVIASVASIAAFQPTPYLAAYGASKAFVLHWSLALNEELRGTKVRAIAICPGPTSTQFFLRAGLQQGSVPNSLSQTTEAVVLESLHAMAKGKAQIVNGWKNRISCFFSARVPKPLAARIGRVILARYRLNAVKR